MTNSCVTFVTCYMNLYDDLSRTKASNGDLDISEKSREQEFKFVFFVVQITRNI